MNSLERIEAAVGWKAPDRTPVIAQVFGHAASLAGESLDAYVQDGEILARCQLNALEHYGYDAVFAVMDVLVETEAVGAILDYRRDMYPVVKSVALSEIDRLEAMRLPDPGTAGRMPELLKSLRILRQNVGSEVLVVGCVLGPMTLAINMMGAETALYLAIDDPERFSRLLSFATEVVIEFGLAQISAGAHLPLVFDPSSTPTFIPPAFFREFELPLLKRMFAAFKQNRALANWLHIAGSVEPILEYYPEAGVDIANVDYCIDPQKAREVLSRTCLDGNIKPLSFVEEDPTEILREARGLVKMFSGQGGFILSSGCEIPPESKPENIVALVEAVKGQG